MLHKNIKWKNHGDEELFEELSNITIHKLATSEATKNRIAANPEQHSATAKKGGYATGHIRGKENVESGHWAEVQKLGTQAFLDGDYIGSEAFYDRSRRGGLTSGKNNKENGNLERLADLKKRQNRQKWAKKLLQIESKEFLPKEARKHLTQKMWFNVMNLSDLVIKLDKRGGYHNTQYYWTLNMEAIQEALNDKLEF